MSLLLAKSMGDPKAALLKSPHPAWMMVSQKQIWSLLLISPRLNILPPLKPLRLCATAYKWLQGVSGLSGEGPMTLHLLHL